MLAAVLRAVVFLRRWGNAHGRGDPVLAVVVAVVVATRFNAEQGVRGVANDTPYGLAASVWTTDVSKAHRTAREIKAGTVWVNSHNAFDAALPFGGYKQSGWGRELGASAIDLYAQNKSVNVCL